MAESQKRFPWWMLACAVLLAILAAALGVIETVGRQGTIVSRYERIEDGMSEEDCKAILGAPDETWTARDGEIKLCTWHHRPVHIFVGFSKDGDSTRVIFRHFEVEKQRGIAWHVRRWAEQAWTAIHGRRR